MSNTTSQETNTVDPWAASSTPNSTDTQENVTSTDPAADPWGASSTPDGTDPWGGSTEGADQVSAGGGTDWLDVPADSIPADSFNLMDPFQHTLIPLDSWVTHAIDWVVINFRPVFQGIRVPIDFILSGFEQMLLSLPRR